MPNKVNSILAMKTPENHKQGNLLMEEYGMTLKYIKGVKNIVADILSRYPTTNNPNLVK